MNREGIRRRIGKEGDNGSSNIVIIVRFIHYTQDVYVYIYRTVVKAESTTYTLLINNLQSSRPPHNAIFNSERDKQARKVLCYTSHTTTAAVNATTSTAATSIPL